MVFIMSTHHQPPPPIWTAVERVRDIEAEFERDMWGFSQLRLQNVGQRACHDTPFLCLFHYDRLLETATLRSLFPVCVYEWLRTCVYLLRHKVQPLPLRLVPSPDYLISMCCQSNIYCTGDIMLTLASNILDVDNHYSLFRLCVSTLASLKTLSSYYPA